MPTTSWIVDRYLVAAAVVLPCVLFTARAADPVNVIKLSTLLIITVALASNEAYRLVRHRVTLLPAGPGVWAAGLLLLALIASTLAAPVTGTAIWGAYGRNSGLLAYLAGLMVLLASMRVLHPPHTRVLVGAVVVAGAFTGSYGLLQWLGIDAVAWNNPFNPVIATLGNPNFASGYLGIAAAVAAGGALWNGWHALWRVASGATAALCLVVGILSGSVQGPIAAGAGLFVVAVASSLGLDTRAKRAALVGLVATAAAAGTVLLLGLALKIGPATSIFTDAGSRARGHYWRAALEMFRSHPFFGVGLDQYGSFWRTARSVESVAAQGGTGYSDAAHSVPLQMLAQGGVSLAVGYAALFLVTLYALARGLLRLTGSQRTLLSAVGGGWLAYQVQSWVSIDQVPLLVLHFALTGGVLAASGVASTRDLRLRGAVAPKSEAPRRGKRVRPAPTALARPLTAGDVALLGAAVVLAAFTVWQATIPLRASVAAAQGDRLLAAGKGNAALESFVTASSTMPSQAIYWERQGALYTRVDQTDLARQAYVTAAEKDPYNIGALRAAADLAEVEGRIDESRDLYNRLVQVDPYNAESLAARAQFELRHGGAAAARDSLEAVVGRLPPDAALLATLGDARAVLSDTLAARSAYEEALILQPGLPRALAGLEKLEAAQAKQG